MRSSFILSAVLALGLGIVPLTVLAQTDQTTTAPMATATINPATGTTENPMVNPTNGPIVNNYPAGNGNGNTGWWGLVGLIGLLGLFGGRSRSTTTISGPP
jgi:hypothetical protein